MKCIDLKIDEAVNFLEENLNVHDTLAIAYKREFAKGEVLNIEEPEYRVYMDLINGDDIATFDFKLDDIKDTLIQYTIYPKEGDEVCVVVL